MCQENKAVPIDLDPRPAHGGESLQGWIPELAGPEEIRNALERAFDYRGDVTLTLKSGERLEGYIFDRRAEGPALEACLVRILPKAGSEKVSIKYSDIAHLEFTGRDTAAGRSFELRLQHYREKKARGVPSL